MPMQVIMNVEASVSLTFEEDRTETLVILGLSNEHDGSNDDRKEPVGPLNPVSPRPSG